MLLWITRNRTPEGGYYSGASRLLPTERTDEEIRLVEDYPDEEWATGNATGFPTGPDGLSDQYWVQWYQNGTTVWVR